MTYTKITSTLISSFPNPRGILYSLGVLTLTVGLSRLYWSEIKIGDTQISELLPASGDQVFGHLELWRLWTATLIHSNLEHLLSNVMMLGIFGFLIGGYFGGLLFPVGTLFFGGIINLIVLFINPPNVGILGASGIVYLLGGAWLTFFILIHRVHRIGQRVLRAVGVTLVLLFPSTYVPTTSYLSHFVGSVIGSICALIYFYKFRAEIRSSETVVTVVEDEDTLES